MNDFFSIMILPFVACLILTGIHAYLGLHIIQRGVIFVDLALAQLAAMGVACAFLFGYTLHSTASYFIALLFTMVGALTFTFTRFKKQVVSQEALIGIVYAVAGAASIMILSRAPEGGEELKSLLVGHLLFIGWDEIIKIAILYSFIGLIHWIFRAKFLLITQDPTGALNSGLSVRWWDFLFYATFGAVVTSSVEIAGVLLVFSYLIVPAVCGDLLATNISSRLIIGWIVSLLTSIAGISASYHFDYPTGATVVCTFGVALIICAAISTLRSNYSQAFQ